MKAGLPSDMLLWLYALYTSSTASMLSCSCAVTVLSNKKAVRSDVLQIGYYQSSHLSTSSMQQFHGADHKQRWNEINYEKLASDFRWWGVRACGIYKFTPIHVWHEGRKITVHCFLSIIIQLLYKQTNHQRAAYWCMYACSLNEAKLSSKSW